MCALSYATATGLTLAAKLLALVLAVATSAVLARGLGPDGRGDYALVTLVPLVVITIANLGIGFATVHRIGRDPDAARSAATNALVFTFGASAVAAAVLFAIAAPLRAIYPAVGAYLVVLALSIPQGLGYLLLQALLQATRRFVASAVLVVVSYVLQIVALVALVVVLRLGVSGAVAAWLAAHFVLVLVTVAVVWRTPGFGRFDAASLLRDVRFGSVSWAGSIALLVTTRASLLAAGALLDAAPVGYLAVAITFAEIIWYVAEAAAFSLAPFVARFGEARSDVITPMVTRMVFGLSIVAALALARMAEPLVVALFGREFTQAVPLLLWLLPGVVSLGIAKVLAADLLGRGRPDLTLRALVAGSAAAILSAAVLVPAAGVVGAAASATVAYVLTTLLLVALYVRIAGASLSQLLTPRTADIVILLRRGRAALR